MSFNMQCLPSVDRYMKYLYTYECEKRQLSTPAELQVAIEGNRREGRRSSYGTYSEMVQRSPVPNLPPSHPSQMSPLSLVTSGRPAMNGNSNHHPSSHPSVHGQPLGAGMQQAIIFSDIVRYHVIRVCIPPLVAAAANYPSFHSYFLSMHLVNYFFFPFTFPF